MSVDRLSPGSLAQIACVLEATARKPGNVHRFADFDDADYLDYILSALAVGPALDRAGTGIGRAVLEATTATRAVVATNTNLGMLLLLAPMCAAPADEPLHVGLPPVLEGTTVEDARAVYEAIRLARPGGLGRAPSQDAAGEPSESLLSVMRLAADRDLVARQYACGFEDVLDFAAPLLCNALAKGRNLETAVVATHLGLLARRPDTLIARKLGWDVSRDASRRASEVLATGWPDTSAGVAALAAFDAWLREDGRKRNPGATADLVCAGLLACLRDGTIRLPLPAGVWGDAGCGPLGSSC
jgi:triphosphoribosyl-dephospho-CoA synthase